MEKYTVVGYWEDNGRPWVAHVEAMSASYAMVEAVECMVSEWEAEPAQIAIVEVFPGHIKGEACTESVAYGNDIIEQLANVGKEKA